MEKNEINNAELVQDIRNKATNFLISQNIIDLNYRENINYEFGYLYTCEDGYLESLFKVVLSSGNIFIALQDNRIKLLKISQEEYEETVRMMQKLHPCLNEVLSNESDKEISRRQKNNELLKNYNITVNDSLLCTYNDNNVEIKDINTICKHAIASLLVIQISCDIRNGLYDKSKEYFMPFLEKFGVINSLNKKERRIIDGTYTEQDVLDMDLEYEVYWSLCWCLGLVDDIKDASVICDCDQAISFVMTSESFENFVNKCYIRNIDDILDMEDLYYRYQWAINEKKVNDETSIGLINPLIVKERLRGLKWVISNTFDWYDVD